MEIQKKGGRPPLPEGERRAGSVRFFLRAREAEALSRAASARGLTPPNLVRMVLTEAGLLGDAS